MKNLTIQDLNFFKTNGYFIVRSFFNKLELKKFQIVLQDIIRIELKRAGEDYSNKIPFGAEFGKGMNLLEKVDHSHISRINDILYSIPEVFRLISDPRINKIINQLFFGQLEALNSPLFCNNVAAILAAPHDETYTHSFHKDTFYTIPESNFLQLWAPLIQNSTVELGTLKICPGSHVNDFKGQVYNKNARYIHRFSVSTEELEKWHQLDVIMELGDMLIFHPGLIHSGGKNTSEKTRFSLVATFHEIAFSKFTPNHTMTGLDYYNQLYGTNF
jgi:ectoine hydroxylase-related dioxygenase (phytanoyl-CoA dioxygenase family)